MKSSNKQQFSQFSEVFPVELVCGAMMYASSMYNKKDGVEYVKSGEGTPSAPTNKSLLFYALENTNLITQEMITEGSRIRNHYISKLMFKAIAGTLNNFEKNLHKCVELKEWDPESSDARMLIGVMASIPHVYRLNERRDRKNDILNSLESKHIGLIKSRVDLTVTLMSQYYGELYDNYNYTGVTSEGDVITFYHKNNVELNTEFEIKATIKAHITRANNRTIINRVRFTETT